jgi:hypothetical protein
MIRLESGLIETLGNGVMICPGIFKLMCKFRDCRPALAAPHQETRNGYACPTHQQNYILHGTPPEASERSSSQSSQPPWMRETEAMASAARRVCESASLRTLDKSWTKSGSVEPWGTEPATPRKHFRRQSMPRPLPLFRHRPRARLRSEQQPPCGRLTSGST